MGGGACWADRALGYRPGHRGQVSGWLQRGPAVRSRQSLPPRRFWAGGHWVRCMAVPGARDPVRGPSPSSQGTDVAVAQLAQETGHLES